MLKDGKTEITCWSTRPEWQQVREYNFPARRKQPPRLEENLQTHTHRHDEDFIGPTAKVCDSVPVAHCRCSLIQPGQTDTWKAQDV